MDAELYTLTSQYHDVMIAGGAAVALLWNQQRITNDVDIGYLIDQVWEQHQRNLD